MNDKREWNLILAVCFQLKQLKKQPEKNSGLNGIRTPLPCNTGTMLYPLSYQATWIDSQLWVRYIPDDSEIYEYEYMKNHICELRMKHEWNLILAVCFQHELWLGSSVDRAKKQKQSYWLFLFFPVEKSSSVTGRKQRLYSPWILWSSRCLAFSIRLCFILVIFGKWAFIFIYDLCFFTLISTEIFKAVLFFVSLRFVMNCHFTTNQI